MFTTDFSTKKFIDCEYRIKYDIHDCTECDINFECEEHCNSFDSLEIKLLEEKFNVFEEIAKYFMPANVPIADSLPC